MSSHFSSHSPRVLKVGGIQAARLSETSALIHRLRGQGPLAVVLSAPNTADFRTTNMLIAAAEALADEDGNKTKEYLHAVRDFVLDLLRKEICMEPCFPALYGEVELAFEEYDRMVDFYTQRRSPSARLYTLPPEEGNDYVGKVLRKPAHGSRSIPRLHSIVPLLELGENLSAIIYTHLTNGISVTSRSWMNDEIGTVRGRVRDEHRLIISGALRMNPKEKMLRLFGRGYTDANASRLAAASQAGLLVHKEHPICTADPRIVNGASRSLEEVSLSAIRASLHPFVGAQFLNPHIFADGEPADIQVGDFGADRVTQVVRGNISGLPLIQKGPGIIRRDAQANFGDLSLSLGDGQECLVSVIDQRENSERISHMEAILGTGRVIARLTDQVASVLVPYDQADDIVCHLHARMCEI